MGCCFNLFKKGQSGRSSSSSTSADNISGRSSSSSTSADNISGPLKTVAVGTVAVGGIVGLFNGIVNWIGFTKAGIAANSIAAGIQSGVGAVKAGSMFATMQSLAAKGVISSIGATGMGIVGISIIGYGIFKVGKLLIGRRWRDKNDWFMIIMHKNKDKMNLLKNNMILKIWRQLSVYIYWCWTI